MVKKVRPVQIENLIERICECIDGDWYTQTRHAIQRQAQRVIELPDALYVLKHGHHEKSKTTFDEAFQSWKYAIRGMTVDKLDLRVIIAFDESGMLIITVMYVA